MRSRTASSWCDLVPISEVEIIDLIIFVLLAVSSTSGLGPEPYRKNSSDSAKLMQLLATPAPQN
jgi:hypothetical protein